MEQFRILIIEDKVESIKVLKDRLEKLLPSPQIDVATGRAAARRLIERARLTGLHYSLELVDLFLPEDLDGTPEKYEVKFDREFIQLVRSERVYGPVFLMTAEADRNDVKKYFDAMDILDDPRFAKFSKRENYPRNVLEACLDTLWGGLIARKIEKAPEELVYKGMTTHLLELRDLIQEHWQYLKGGSRETIGQWFIVDESVNPPGVRLK